MDADLLLVLMLDKGAERVAVALRHDDAGISHRAA